MKKTMKLTYLFALALLLTTVGCNNDDNATAINEINVENLTVTIDENPTNGQSVGTVQADGEGTLSFSISAQTPVGALSVNSSTGEVSVANATLFDFETNPVITATISVVGAENTGVVTINLNDLNEISAQDLAVTIDENPTDGQNVGAVQADGDGTISFSITSQTPAGAFDIDASTGELTVADATLFDYETNPTITVTISVDNSGNMTTVTATISLNDINELSAQDLEVTIDENPIDGQSVGTIQVDGNGPFSFSIETQTPGGALTIDASTGELTVVDPNLFDFETNPIITANILVDNSVETTTAVASINLNDVDEITVQDLNTSIDENPLTGAVIGTLQATGGGSLTYTITFQNPVGAFNIDQNTGELSVADETLFDFETNPNMLATISVDDGVSSVSASAFVGTNDVNEIGEFKYGGVIFWMNTTNDAGLVCAVSDQGTNVSWGCQGTTLGGTSNSIGTGAANTAAIIAGCSTSGIAADVVSNATINGFSDWFLPSRSELNQMYIQRAIIDNTALANGGTAFIADTSTRYWSSSESNGNTAWCKIFINGTDAGLNKGSGAFFQARAVRAFSNF